VNLQEIKIRLSHAEKDLMPKARLEQFNKVRKEVEQYLTSLTDQKAAEELKFDQEAEKLKPESKDISRQGFLSGMLLPSGRPYETDAEKTNRHLAESKQISVLNYMAKTILSKIAGEADTPESFLDIVTWLANNEDKQVKHVFLDNYRDILAAGQSLENFGRIENEVKEQYKFAQESLKSEKQVQYEKALNEAQRNKSRLFQKYYPLEQNAKEALGYVQGKVVWLNDELNGGKEEESSEKVW
jgi:hypothetical protein